jgi:hypothetical protein
MEPTANLPLWNSLEVVKLLTSALTPLTVFLLGIWVKRRLKRLEDIQWGN